MKPIKLEFQGINSYAKKTVIDFDKLLKYGLFGIFGNTGSGKSTILDCIMIALYSKTAKGLQPNDFVNNGCNYAFVNFVFSMKEEGVDTIYRVFHEFKTKENRKLGSAQHKAILSYFDSSNVEVPLAEGVEAVNARCLKIIGLKYDEFENCIILPQGEFAAFVSMNDSARRKMMGSLFSLEKYGVSLYQKVKSDCDRLKTEIASKEGSLEAYSDSTYEAKTETEKLVKQSDEELKDKNIIISKIEEEYEKNKKNYDRHNNLKDKKLQLKTFEITSDEMNAKKQNINRYFDAVEIKNLADKKDKIRQTINFENANIERLNKSLAVVLEKLKKIDDKKLDVEKMKLKIAELNRKQISLENLSDEISQLGKLNKQLDEQRKRYSSLSQDKKSEQKKMQELIDKQSVFQLKGENQNIKNEIDEILKKIENSTGKSLIKDDMDFLELIKLDSNFEVAEKIEKRIEGLKLLLSSDCEDIRTLMNNLKSCYDKFDVVRTEEAELASESAKIQSSLAVLNESLSSIENEGKLTRENFERAKQKIFAVTNGEDYAEAVNAVKLEIESLSSNLTKIEQDEKKFNEEKNELEKQLAVSNSKLLLSQEDEKLVENELSAKISKGFSSFDQACKIVESIKDFEKTKKEVEDYFNQVFATKQSILELENELKGVEIDDESFKSCSSKFEQAKVELDLLLKNNINLHNTLKNLSQKYEKRCIIENTLKNIKIEYSLYDRLLQLVKSNALVDFVAEEYLKEIAGLAKTTLLELTDGKFGLCYDKEFFIEDNMLGGERRKIDTASGGELFLVSLSLALSLSRSIYARSRKPIEFFFLDEGFGSLDSDKIETVMDSIDKLRASQFSVGIITHVDALKERITAKICVSGATDEGGSTLTVTA